MTAPGETPAAAVLPPPGARYRGGRPRCCRRRGRAGNPDRAPAAGRQAAAVHVVGGPELARPGVIVNYPSHAPRRCPGYRPAHSWSPTPPLGRSSPRRNRTAIRAREHTQDPYRRLAHSRTEPGRTVVASRRAVSGEPDVVGLKLGHRYKIADLFRALLLISGNDAAIALAEATGSFGRGVALMNAEAHQLQADDTVASRPNGLDARGQHVSAYDEALIARRALRIPAFLGYDRTPCTWFPITPRQRIELFNEDRLLTTYRGFIGGKTGWTTPAMATYVGMARRQWPHAYRHLAACSAGDAVHVGRGDAQLGF